jgi:predicted SnoaL-like aldol condensation-catalyzing enzyme
MRPTHLLTSALPLLTTATATATASSSAATANCPGRPATTAEQKVIFADFVNAFYVTKNVTKAFLDHVAEDYIQHNPGFPSGRQVAMDGLKNYVPGLKVSVARTSVSDNAGWVMVKQESSKGAKGYSMVVDVFRFDGTCIVEHWDVIQVS